MSDLNEFGRPLGSGVELHKMNMTGDASIRGSHSCTAVCSLHVCNGGVSVDLRNSRKVFGVYVPVGTIVTLLLSVAVMAWFRVASTAQEPELIRARCHHV
jgi:hypothetical protein